MTQNSKSSELAGAVSKVQHFIKKIAVAEAQLAECQKKLACEEGMLQASLATAETSKNMEYLEVSRNAFRAGIKVWSLSKAAYQNDIDTFNSEINAIYKRHPRARLDN